MQWVTDLYAGLRSHGGEASLPQLYRWIELHRREPLPPNWKSTVRAELQSYCSESRQYRPGNPDLFRNPERGWWAIRKLDTAQPLQLPVVDLAALVISQLDAAGLKEFAASTDPIAWLKLKAHAYKLELGKAALDRQAANKQL